MTDIPFINEQLRIEEGKRSHAYEDGEGNWTIGIGFLVDSRIDCPGLPEEVMDFWLDLRLAKCLASLVKNIDGWNSLPGNVQDALMLMRFQLGMTRLRRFKKTIAHIEAGDYTEASQECLRGSHPGTASKWAQQTPARAKRVSELMGKEIWAT